MGKIVKEKMYLKGEEFLIMIELSKSSENYSSRELLCDENKQWLDNVIKVSKNYNWKLVLEKDNIEKGIYTYSFKTTKANKWINDKYIRINLNYDFMENYEILKKSNPLNQFTRKYNLQATDTLFMINQGNINILVKKNLNCKNIEEEIIKEDEFNCDNNKYVFQLIEVYSNSIKYIVHYNDDKHFSFSSLIFELELPKDIDEKLTQFKKDKNRVNPKIISFNNLVLDN
jgi:hypothetical protein